MRLTIEAVLDYDIPGGADVLLAIEVAPMADQRIVEDKLTVTTGAPLRPIPGEEGIGRRTWTRGEGAFEARYAATVDVDHPTVPIEGCGAAPRRELPALVVPYLWPSRYCESDRFEAFVAQEFGALAGGAKVAAMAAWIGGHLSYVSGASDGTTTAADTFVQRQGVCRDYAHLLTTFCRAAGIPARCVSAYALDLQPPDFHAVVEVWLEGGWRMVDATGMSRLDGIARIQVGRDATDIAFMTIFGSVILNRQSVQVVRSV